MKSTITVPVAKPVTHTYPYLVTPAFTAKGKVVALQVKADFAVVVFSTPGYDPVGFTYGLSLQSWIKFDGVITLENDK